MAFKPDRTQPDFADLVTSLNNSRNQIKDNPLYQTIFILLNRITTSRNNIVKQLEDIDEAINEVLSLSFLTVNDESLTLVNSRRLVAGANISFDDTTANVRRISAGQVPGLITSNLLATDGVDGAAGIDGDILRPVLYQPRNFVHVEGDWTPTVTFGGGSTGITYTSNVGKYVRIGRLVALSGLLQLSNKGSSTGSAVISGLPFTIGDTTFGFFSSSKVSYNAFTAGVQEVGLQSVLNTTTMIPVKSVTGTNTQMTDADFTNTSTLVMYLNYLLA